MNTRQRLEKYRARAAKYAGEPYSGKWKYWTCSVWRTPNNARGVDGKIFSESLDQYGENLGDAHDIDKGIKHTGWYADSYQDALIKGAVCKLRTSRGTYYIPATYCTDWDGTTHYINDAAIAPKGGDEFAHEEAARQAARIADGWAEREAEEAREYHAKDQAEQQILTARDRIHSLNQKTLALIREIKAAGRSYTPAVCLAVTEAIKDGLDARRAEFHRIAELESNYWAAVE